MTAGRPSEFAQETADFICEHIVEGKSLRTICAGEGMPNKSTVFRWLASNPQFCDQYARARELQADVLFDEILYIADDRVGDVLKSEDGREAIDHDAINRAKLRIDTRKWMAGKLKPKKYGDKLDLSHSGPIQQLSDEQLIDRINRLDAAIEPLLAGDNSIRRRDPTSNYRLGTDII